MRYFEDYVVGQRDVYNGSYTLTEAEIREVGERWDPQPFHIDPVAAEASLFGGLVASSVHLFAIMVAIGTGTMEEPVAAVSALGFDNVRLHQPARPGDELKLRSEVLGCRASESRPGTGIVRFARELVNQRGEVVFSDESAALIERRPVAGAPGLA